MINILIGVGGTGAKIVEAAMVLLAAGAGPKQVHVGLVDQDSSNGNIARTKTLISRYQEFKHQWQGSSPSSIIDWRGPQADLHFCQSEVLSLFGDSAAWCPGGDQTTIANMIGQNLQGGLADLFDLLFMEGPEEQDLVLGEGYRGRAHVGAAALIARLADPSNPLTLKLGELMAGGGGHERVNIFIAGSAFGGTGAAGFPTIARELHRIRTSKEFTNKGQVAIAGALMLPYFGFAPPDVDQKDFVVTTDELLPKAQLALEHYSNLFQSEPAFDRFYLVGWERFFQLNYHEAGNAEQCNPPLLPELVAASAAMSFFASGPDSASAGVTDERVRVSARRAAALRWSDMPSDDMQARLGGLLRFALYWRYIVSDLVDERRPFFGKGNWTHRLTDKADREGAHAALNALDSLLDTLLLYAASLEHAAGDQWQPGLWRLGALQDYGHSATPTDPVRLVSSLPNPTEVFSDAVKMDDGHSVGRDAAAVYDELEGGTPTLPVASHKGYGRVVSAAFHAARVS